MKFRVNRGDQNRQWKLDRRQLKFRSGDLERQAHGDLAAHQHHTGGVQGRRGLECDRQYQRRMLREVFDIDRAEVAQADVERDERLFDPLAIASIDAKIDNLFIVYI